jgi:hypothetical protein
MLQQQVTACPPVFTACSPPAAKADTTSTSPMLLLCSRIKRNAPPETLAKY